jgi:hypothetical protein
MTWWVAVPGGVATKASSSRVIFPARDRSTAWDSDILDSSFEYLGLLRRMTGAGF